MGKVAFLFPGQGSQHVGMAKDVYDNHEGSKQLIEKADSTLNDSLSTLMFEGPEETLKRTENAQPALLSTSCAVLEAVKERNMTPDYVAGHSLGEYSALVAAGVLSFEDAVYAVRQRGLFMEDAVPAGEGAMSAVMGLDRKRLEDVCKQASQLGETAELANMNGPGQIVISGTAAGVKKAGELAKEAGARRVIPLPVSGPFHSSLMEPVAMKLEDVLMKLTFHDATIPVITNVTAREATKKDDIRKRLIEQVTAPVLWEDSIRYLLEQGVDTFVEIGAGSVLSGLVRKIQRRGVQVYAVSDLESLEKMVKEV